MVSFQCEACGDVLTKKKLDPHRSQCRGAYYTCLDCMTTFNGTEYRAHTSCITEDQKYQGALYREKQPKNAKRKSVSILEPGNHNALVPKPAYVEDAEDIETPPHVPSPPPAVPSRDSVFDYMVDEEQPNTPKIAFSKNKEEMSMKNGAPSVFSNSRASSRNGYRNSEEQVYTKDYQDNGFSYGTEPVNPRPFGDMNGSLLSLEFMTPAAKETRAKLDHKERPSLSHSRTNSGSEKKRKRGETDPQGFGNDAVMTNHSEQDPKTTNNTPAMVHSGLTGGLSRMMSDTNEGFPYPPSPDDEDHRHSHGRHDHHATKREDPTSPLKRSRHSRDDSNGLGISIKGRAAKAISMVGGALLPVSQHDNSSKTRRRASSSDGGQGLTRGREGEKRERKKHKVQRHNGTSSANVRYEHRSRRRGTDESPEASRRKLKAIEYRKHGDSASDSEEDRRAGGNSQMVVFGAEERQKRLCESFLAQVPTFDTEKGYSINKTLKRWHKDSEIRGSSHKIEEEKDLWRGLRVKKNDRGEIVLFC